MLTVEDAQGEVMRRAAPLPPRRHGLGDVLGCVLAEDVAADRDWPPFDKALVDGFAVRAADVDGPGRALRVGEEITAGRTPSRPLDDGEAAVIMTGAPLPAGADAYGSYTGLQTRIWVPGDVDSYGQYNNYGYSSSTSYAGRDGLSAGYWVYVSPYWYIWNFEK